jgi:ABC-type nitrate/sulfonate/bicarbonate transport system permease component
MSITNQGLSWQTVARWIAAVVALCIGWQILGNSGAVFGISPFTEVMTALWEALRTSALWDATLGTLEVAAVGYVIATVLGVGIGLLTGLNRTAAYVLDPLINAAYSTPTTMFVPVIGVYMGLGYAGKVFLVVMFCVFLIIINTAAGARSVPATQTDLARVFGLSRMATWRKVILPAAAPYIFTGLRVSVAKVVAGAIVAQLLMSSSDLGLYLSTMGNSFNIDGLLAGIVFVSLLGGSLMMIATVIERRALRWKRGN